MAIDNVAELVRRFEPVLFFHPDERFFPSDAKRYIEKSALWTVKGTKRDDKVNWGGSGLDHFPRHPKLNPPLAAATGEVGAPASAPLDPGVDEVFLDLAGWRDSTDVTTGSANTYANLDEIAARYGKDLDDGLDKPLQNSRFWYHAEVFDLARLRLLIDANLKPNLTEAFAALKPNSVLLCYYLFYPGTDGGLEGCDGETAQLFDHAAGQWTCISLLLDGTSQGNGQPTTYTPTSIAMTSRAPGLVTTSQTEARHFGMTANSWSLVSKVVRDRGPGQLPGEHPLIFVARQTHGYYLGTGPQATFPPLGNDAARATCGSFETFEEVFAEEDAVNAGYSEQRRKNSLFKWFCLFGGPLGAFFGLGYSGGVSGLANLGGPGTPEAPPQFDHPPDAGVFGFVVHPEGVTLSNVQSGKQVVWPRFGVETNMSTNILTREYSLLVGSSVQTFSRPPWLPSDNHASGFRGRWGNRVTADPQSRRAGMEFMEFWQLSLLAFRKAQST
jgi:hypothetical protein